MTSVRENTSDTLVDCRRLVDAGKSDDALRCLEQLIDAKPENSDALNALGELLGAMGRIDDAVDAFERALKARPGFSDARMNLATAMSQTGRIDEAKAQCESVIASNPGFAPAYQQLAGVCHVSGDFAGVVRNLREVIQLQPQNHVAFTNLGAALQFQGRFEKAEAMYRRALELEPQHVDALCNLGMLCLQLGRGGEAREHLTAALEIQPGNATARAGLADQLTVSGNHGAAADMLEPEIQRGVITPNIAVAYARCKTGLNAADSALPVIDQALNLHGINSSNVVQLLFARGDLQDKLRQYDEAFASYAEANRVAKVEYDLNKEVMAFHELIRAFTREFLRRLPHVGNESEVPVFVVGMPRSGKSLVEQILASHDSVFGAGELTGIGHACRGLQELSRSKRPYPLFLEDADIGTLSGIAETYLTGARSVDAQAKRVVDTMPGNFRHIGLIEILFPGARIIHCVREPRDLVVSCFSKFFAGRSMGFSFDLGNTATFLLEYQRLMTHWREICSLPIFEVAYEDMVRNTETVTRQLIEFLGLEWQPQCMDYYRDGVASLASDERVHVPLDEWEVGRWTNYAKHLGKVEEILNSAESEK